MFVSDKISERTPHYSLYGQSPNHVLTHAHRHRDPPTLARTHAPRTHAQPTLDSLARTHAHALTLSLPDMIALSHLPNIWAEVMLW